MDRKKTQAAQAAASASASSNHSSSSLNASNATTTTTTTNRRATKRSAKVLEDPFWDCSVCTYTNSAEAFKCAMCDVRKGTSTRKARLNSALVAQQAATMPASSASTSIATATAATPAVPGFAAGPSTASNGPTTSGSGSSSSLSLSNGAGPSSGAAAATASTSSSGAAPHAKVAKVRPAGKSKHKKYPARLMNVDRSTAQTREVTVNSVTVVITEYLPMDPSKVASAKAAAAAARKSKSPQQPTQQQHKQQQQQANSRRESSEQSMSESNDSRS